MDNNRIYIIKLIKSFIITIILLNIFMKTPDFKIIFVLFLICSVAVLIRDILMLIGKYNYVNIFNKIYIGGFLLFLFGFLFWWCYISFINKEYNLLLFSIPFWICGVMVIKKKLL